MRWLTKACPYARRQRLVAVASWLAHKYQHNLKPLHSLLAYHYSRADNHQEALQYAILAADEARNIFANREAINLYTLAERHLQALADVGLWETAIHLYLSRGESLRFVGDFNDAIRDAEQAAELAIREDDKEQWAKMYDLIAELNAAQPLEEEAQLLTDE